MEIRNLVIFCIALILPFIFFRTALYIIAKPIKELTVYTREGLKFHHFHYGIMLLLVGVLGFLTLGPSMFPTVLVGLGLGTMLDEYYPSLFLPEQEPAVTALYRKSFRPTAFILLSIVGIVLLLGLVLNKT